MREARTVAARDAYTTGATEAIIQVQVSDLVQYDSKGNVYEPGGKNT